MSVFRIAWRSIQHRGLGSLLTIVSMALGVMTVVAVLTIHGVVSRSFHANSSFGYDVIIGSRGGSMQLTLNTVYYLSKPLEPIPFEYYLAFLPNEAREPYLKNSIAYQAHLAQQASLEMTDGFVGGFGVNVGQAWAQAACRAAEDKLALEQMTIGKDGDYADWVEAVIPLALGDTYSRDLEDPTGGFRVVGTTSDFFSKLVLDAETGRKFAFAQGRALSDFDPEHGYFECVVGSQVAQVCNVILDEKINPIHGLAGTPLAHRHEDHGFAVVGILAPTGTPHDRAVFVNIEGFYLMDDHAKPIEEGLEATGDESATEEGAADGSLVDATDSLASTPEDQAEPNATTAVSRDSLPMEQREVTALLIRTDSEDPIVGSTMIGLVNNGGWLEPVLRSSQFRPVRAQVAPQAVSPIYEITSLFLNIVDPIRWILLGLTILICIVSGISILVGIYNSMNQRRHEIAVLRALGARRSKVTQIMLAESIMLSLAGGVLGWFAGHLLNAALSPTVEARAGVRIGFFDFAPAVNWGAYLNLGNSKILNSLVQYLTISPEFLLIPGMILLAILVGVYPAVSAYRTDVAKSLGT